MFQNQGKVKPSCFLYGGYNGWRYPFDSKKALVYREGITLDKTRITDLH